MAPPRNDAATGRYLDSRSLAMATPGKTENVERSHFDIEGGQSRPETMRPTHPPRISASAPWVAISPERRRLTTMKVSAVMLWVMPPARIPQSNAEERLFVHRLADLRAGDGLPMS